MRACAGWRRGISSSRFCTGKCKGRKRDRRHPADERIDARGRLAMLDEPMAGARRDDKADDENHEAKNDKLNCLLGREQLRECVLKSLETETRAEFARQALAYGTRRALFARPGTF
jgi:hypothetical protein